MSFKSITHFVHRALPQVVLAFGLLTACTDAPSWQKLLAAKILDQFPSYQVEPAPNGGLTVKRPGLADSWIDVEDIARFCRRGPKDCDYATDQMLLRLRGP